MARNSIFHQGLMIVLAFCGLSFAAGLPMLDTSPADDGYSIYVWTWGFDKYAPHCDGVYPINKDGLNATCFRHNWESPEAREKLWASCKSDDPDRKITRIFMSDVWKRIRNNGLASSGECDQDLMTTLTEAHQRSIRVYALFAASDAAFSEIGMVNYVNQFNDACGTDQIYFDGVSVNNEHFSKVKGCDDPDDREAQLQTLQDLEDTVTNASPLPVHFSVSWNWDCCDCSESSYVVRELDWNGKTQSALQHMIDIVDSVDVQVAYNTPSAITRRSRPPHQYWTEKANKTETSALYVLVYTNPNYLCQLSFSPHGEGSDTAEDECNVGGERTEAAMYAAFDTVEEKLEGVKGGIHFMNGVYGTGITEGWPEHYRSAPTDAPTVTPTPFPTNAPVSPTAAPIYCVDDPEWRFRGKRKKSCTWLDGRSTWTDTKKKKWCNKRANNDRSDKTKVWVYCKATCDAVGIMKACLND